MRKKILLLLTLFCLCFCFNSVAYASTEEGKQTQSTEQIEEENGMQHKFTFKQIFSLVFFFGVAVWVYATVPNETVDRKKKGLFKKKQTISNEEYLKQIKKHSAEIDEEIANQAQIENNDYADDSLDIAPDDYEAL